MAPFEPLPEVLLQVSFCNGDFCISFQDTILQFEIIKFCPLVLLSKPTKKIIFTRLFID
jgi:hypothetical protein